MASQQPPDSAQSDVQSVASEQPQDVWAELFGTVHGLAETLNLALQAFTPTDDKVSATTKKRLAVRSIQSLKQGQTGIQALLEHLKALHAASQTWQRSMMYASKSHQELMEQVETTTKELHATSERLRSVEAQRIASVREAESLRAQTAQLEAMTRDLQQNLRQREEELEAAQFQAHEAQAERVSAQQSLERLQASSAQAEERAQAATAGLDEAKAEAAKAHGLAERHQQVVAKLTADNLVFLMQLKKAEADLANANQERQQLRLAAEQQRGPWFDQVRAGVEERVKQAMQRSQELEGRLERREAEHARQLQALEASRAELERQLASTQAQVEELQAELAAATDSQNRANGRCTAAEATAGELRQRLDDLAAENRVLQESVRAMRQECTERWVTEQAAVGRVSGLEEHIGQLEGALEAAASQAASLQRQVDTQLVINRQLMAKKEEVEWQLMAAMAKVDGGVADGPVPLNLRVSGLLQVGGKEGARGAGAAPGASSAGPSLSQLQVEHVPQGSAGMGSGAGGAWAAGASGPPGGQRATGTEASRGHGATSANGPEPASRTGSMSRASPAPSLAPPQPAPAPAVSAAPVPTAFKASSAEAGPHASAGGASSVALTREPTLAGSVSGALHAPATTAAPEEASRAVSAGLRASQEAPSAQTRAPPAESRGASTDVPSGLRLEPGPVAGPLRGIRVGPASTQGPGSETQGRWMSVEALEGASTVFSSPPSSVAISTEPGSPFADELRAPSTASSRPRTAEPAAASAPAPAPAPVPAPAPAPPAARPFTIRTVSQPPPPGVGRGAAPASAHATPSATPPLDAIVERRGSLHDGGDVWMAGFASSSSDDSDIFFAAGIAVEHGLGGSSVAQQRRPPPQREVLDRLQQELQDHLHSDAAGAPADRAPAAAASGAERAAMAAPPPADPTRDTDADVIHVRAAMPRPSASSGIRISVGHPRAPASPPSASPSPAPAPAPAHVPAPAPALAPAATSTTSYTMRTAPSPYAQPTRPSPAAASRPANTMKPTADALFMGGDAGAGVFSIMRRDPRTIRHRASPEHPAFNAVRVSAPSSPAPSVDTQRQEQQALQHHLQQQLQQQQQQQVALQQREEALRQHELQVQQQEQQLRQERARQQHEEEEGRQRAAQQQADQRRQEEARRQEEERRWHQQRQQAAAAAVGAAASSPTAPIPSTGQAQPAAAASAASTPASTSTSRPDATNATTTAADASAAQALAHPQAGPPYFATGGPVTGEAAVAMDRWARASGGGGALVLGHSSTGPHSVVLLATPSMRATQQPSQLQTQAADSQAALRKSSDISVPQLQPQYQPYQAPYDPMPLPFSPARAPGRVTVPRSPSSPVHPASMVAPARSSAPGMSPLFAVSSPRPDSPAGAPAPTRQRVSFHGLSRPGDAASDDARPAANGHSAAYAPGNSGGAQGTGEAGGGQGAGPSGGQSLSSSAWQQPSSNQPSKANSIKSVRFSDQGMAAEAPAASAVSQQPQAARDGATSESASRAAQWVTTSLPMMEDGQQGRRPFLRTITPYERPEASPIEEQVASALPLAPAPEPYHGPRQPRPAMPMPFHGHPAYSSVVYVGSRPADSAGPATAAQALAAGAQGQATAGLDAPDATPSRRYNASVAVTAVPSAASS